MARAPELPAAAMASIAAQIGSRLPSLGAPAPSGTPGLSRAARIVPPQIGESFPVYMVGLDALRSGNTDLSRNARPTGLWHHQIRYGAQAQDIARSKAPPPGGPQGQGWQVQEVVRSPAAPRIDATIAWIDNNRNVPEDAEARLLVVPAFYLTAFWLHAAQSDSVVIADMPPHLGELQPMRLYAAADFLRMLAAAPPISGVPNERPPG